jgi:glycosyltransferase involved in cell wall biosynthesis
MTNCDSILPARLSVVVPAYNEEATLARVVDKLLLIPNLLEIIIVDDCSEDGTPVIARQLAARHRQVRFLRQPRNGGKTAALKAGFAATSGDVVIVQDADLEYDPSEIKDVVQPILDGVADVVFGSRFMVRKASRVLYFYHFLANKALTFFSNVLTNVNFSDVETGYKAFRGEIIRNMIITSSGFGFEIEVTAKVCKLGCATYEVPISYYGRTYEQGKKIGLKDGIAALWYVLRYNWFTSLKASYRTIPNLRASEPPFEAAKQPGSETDQRTVHSRPVDAPLES